MNKDIVSTNEEDKPLIIISEEAINLKRDNDKLKKEAERLKEMKLHTEKYASEMEDKYILEKTKNDKAIEYIEYYLAKGRTKNHKQFDLSLYKILTGKNLFNLTMKEIEQFFKGVDKE